MHIGVALADIHIIPNADDIRHKRNHVRGFAHGFAVGDLAFALVKVLHLEAEQIAGRSKREARAGGIIPEEADAKAAVKNFCGNVVLPEVAQRIRNGEHGLQLITRLFPGQEKVAFIHVFKIQLVEFVGKLLYVAHLGLHAYLMLLFVLPARNWQTSPVLFSSL